MPTYVIVGVFINSSWFFYDFFRPVHLSSAR
jgi:hypothetical protein